MGQKIKTDHVVVGVAPVDLQTGPISGDYVSLKNYDHCQMVLFTGAGTGVSAVTVKQAQDVAGTGEKAFSFNKVFKVTDHTASDVAAEVAVTSDTFSTGGVANEAFAIEIDADMLDGDNGFDCVRIELGDTGVTALQGAVIYNLSGRRYQAGEQITQSAIID